MVNPVHGYFLKDKKVCFILHEGLDYNVVSIPWDCTKHFTLHLLADLFIPTITTNLQKNHLKITGTGSFVSKCTLFLGHNYFSGQDSDNVTMMLRPGARTGGSRMVQPMTGSA